MSSRDPDLVICVHFTVDDVVDIAADNDIDIDVARERAEEWGKHIESTVSGLAHEQLQNVIVSNQP